MFGHYIPAGGTDHRRDLRRFGLDLDGDAESAADAPAMGRSEPGDTNAAADPDTDVGSCTALGLLELILHAATDMRDRPFRD
ncbi:hypothetical protein [Streptomyces sp. NPDC048639]|uniref:hypothetical protein n=1 Tax=Streptomyces sp. NPDC048639 TaxID=3365581 RepID=UPI00371FF615